MPELRANINNNGIRFVDAENIARVNENINVDVVEAINAEWYRMAREFIDRRAEQNRAFETVVPFGEFGGRIYI